MFKEIRLKLQVDLNQAGRLDLEDLPGIGPALAERVIKYRQSIGKFTKTEEILNVKGFGAKRYASLKEFLIVKDPQNP